MTDVLPIWTFGYKPYGPATTAQVSAHDEREALAVATAWCATQNVRFLGTVRPFVVADPSILGKPVPEPQPELPSPVEATTGLMGRVGAAIGLK